jgi:hypothetical protein
MDVQDGLCQCGCGQQTTIAKRSDKRDGYVKGQPLRFVRGHVRRLAGREEPDPCQAPDCNRLSRHVSAKYCAMHASRLLRHGSFDDPKPTLMDRFFACVAEDGECWRWIGYTGTHGYGVLSVEGRQRGAHRVAYELLRAEIPDGLQIDHLCRNPACVNPWHLEPVTPRVNTLRNSSPIAHQASRDSCPNDHEYTPENLRITPSGQRVCRICERNRDARKRAAKRGKRS